MEYNKDEAVREKVIAEGKLTEKDYAGAKKFALKAQALYPELDGLTQMFATLEVYISGEMKVNGEVDWYRVLGVSPSADEETVGKQYRKLALMLHPDENKSLGAEGAFKLVSEAWSVLSDKSKRQAYNQRRSAKGLQQKVPTNSPPTVLPPQQKTDTFWTICLCCKIQYEYRRIYLDRTLSCPNCRGIFLASETPAPNYDSSTSSSSQTQAGAAQKSQPKRSVPFSDTNIHRLPFSSNASVAGNIVQQACERLKRQREELHVAGGWEKLLEKKRGLGDDFNGTGVKTALQVGAGHVGAGAQNVPKGCQELDTAATPLELLQVITKADDATKEEPEEKTGEEKLWSAPPPAAVDEMVADTPEARQ